MEHDVKMKDLVQKLKDIILRFGRRREVVVISLIVLFYTVNNLVWLVQNTFPAGPDEPTHLIISSVYGKLLTLDIEGAVPFFPRLATNYWPPLYHVTAAGWGLITGGSYVSSVMVNILYFALLLVSLYLTGLKLFDRQTGLMAAVLVSLYPIVFRYSRFFGPDFALTALVSAGVCSLLYSDFFGRRKGSVLLGVVIGLGMLTKWTYILYLAGPLGYVLWRAWKSGPFGNRGKNMAFCFGSGALISSVWYIPFFSLIIRMIRSFFKQIFDFQTDKVVSGLKYGLTELSQKPNSFISSVNFTINEEMSLIFFLLLAGVFYLYISRRRNRAVSILWFALPYLALALPSPGRARFLLPVVPALALISAAGLGAFSSVRTRSRIFFSVVILGLFQYFYVSYNTSRRDLSFSLWSPVGRIHPLYSTATEDNAWFYGAPEKKDWKFSLIVDSIKKGTEEIPELRIGVVSRKKEFSFEEPLNYHLMKSGMTDAKIVPLFSFPGVLEFIQQAEKINCIVHISEDEPWPGYGYVSEDLQLILEDANRILTEYFAKGDTPLFSTLVYKLPIYEIDDIFKAQALSTMKALLDGARERFSLLDSIGLPDGYTAYIYRREEPEIEEDGSVARFINGRAYITYKGEPVTAGYQGIETCFVYNKRGYASSDAVWDVRYPGKGLMEARGTWKGLAGLTQVWRIGFSGSGIVCKAEIETEIPCSIKDFCITTSVPDKYGSYSTAASQGDIGHAFRDRLISGSMPYVGIRSASGGQGLVFHAGRESQPSFQLGRQAYGRTYVSMKEEYFWLRRGKNRVAGMEVSVFPGDGSGLELKLAELRESAVVRNGKVFAFFSNGRVQLWHAGKRLTSDLSGMETGFRYDSREYYSSRARWDVRKVSPTGYRAIGSWDRLAGIAQVWDLELAGSAVECSVRYKGSDVSKMGDTWINTALTSEYRAYKTIDKKGRFLLRLKGGTVDERVPCIGLSGRRGLPWLLFHAQDPDRAVLRLGQQAGGAGYVSVSSRGIDPLEGLGMKIGIYPGSDTSLESGMEEVKGGYVIGSGPVKLFFWEGQVHIWYKGRKVSGDISGMTTRFIYNGKEYSSKNASGWEVKKVTECRMEACCVWEDLDSVKQVFEFRTEEGRVSCNVSLDVGKDMDIEGFVINTPLSERYTKYRSLYGGGGLAGLSTKLPGEESMPYIGIDKKAGLPALIFHNLSGYQSGFRISRRIASSASVSLSEDRLLLHRGTNPVTGLEVSIIPHAGTGWERKMDEIRERAVIRKGEIFAFFSNGRMQLWYGDRRLTAERSGMETGFEYGGTEYYSSGARWGLKKAAQGRYVATGGWDGLPGVLQIWEMELVDDAVECRVRYEGADISNIGKTWINTALSSIYRTYETIDHKGSFSLRLKGEILDKSVPYISIVGHKGLPNLLFHSEDPDRAVLFLGQHASGAGYVNMTDRGAAPSEGNCMRIRIYPVGRAAVLSRMEEVRERYVIGSGSVKLFFWEGYILLWYDDFMVTSSRAGIRTGLIHDGRAYGSGNASIWEVRKVTDSRLEAKCSWAGLEGVRQVWEITAADDKILSEISLETDKEIHIERSYMDSSVSEMYKEYRIQGGSGFMSRIAVRDVIDGRMPYVGLKASGHPSVLFRDPGEYLADFQIAKWVDGTAYVSVGKDDLELPRGRNRLIGLEVSIFPGPGTAWEDRMADLEKGHSSGLHPPDPKNTK